MDEPEPEDSLAKELGLSDVREDFRSHADAEPDLDDAEEEPGETREA
jgi:hypothetical protein